MQNKISLTLQPIDIEMDKVTLEHQPYIIQYPFSHTHTNNRQRELTNSIKQYGLFAPIIVQKTKEDITFIVHGAKRFLACQSMGCSTISSRVLPYSIQDQKVYLLSLSLFLSHKKPNSMEQAKIIRKLLSPPARLTAKRKGIFKNYSIGGFRGRYCSGFGRRKNQSGDGFAITQIARF